jgi:hypothetical protein
VPLDGTSVFHPDWNTHHRATATSAMTAACTITRRAGAPTTSADGTVTPPAPATVYEGPCRFVPRTDERHRAAGDWQVTPRRYDIGILYDADPIHIGDTVTVTAAADAGLVGLAVRVVDVAYSSEQWQRNVVAEELQEGAA